MSTCEEYTKRCIDDAINYDVVEEAVKSVYSWVMNGATLSHSSSEREKLLDELIMTAIRDDVHRVRHAVRAPTGKGVVPTATSASKNIDTHLFIQRQLAGISFFKAKKIRDKSLGNCDAEDLNWIIDHLESGKKGLEKKIKYYSWLRSKLKLDKKVSDCVKQATAERQWKRIIG